jgi:hypothetical protein
METETIADSEAEWAIKDLAANLLRIMAGVSTAAPGEVVSQCRKVVEAYTDRPSVGIITTLQRPEPTSPEEAIIDSALRIAAAKVAGSAGAMRYAREQFQAAIGGLETERA